MFTATDYITDGDFVIGWGTNELEWPSSIILCEDSQIGFATAEWLRDKVASPYGEVVPHSGELWCPHSLYLNPEYRGYGLGQWLLLALSEAVREQKLANLVPADWLQRDTCFYVPDGSLGTSLAALRCWDRLGAPL